jgi:lipoate---protein ligase
VALLAEMPAAGPPAYSWSTVASPGLVLGRLARDPALDRAAIDAEGVVVVRRSSGGGPVLWDRDLLALDVVLPRGHRLAVDDVVAAYRWLGEAIADGLRSLGVAEVEVIGVERARRARGTPGPAADACFGGLSPFEVLAGGRKVAGLSQARRRPGTLLQAGVPLALDSRRLARLMGRDAAFARGLRAGAAGLRELMPDLTAARVIAAIDAAVSDRAGVRLTDDGGGAGTDADPAAATSRDPGV